MDIVKRFLLWLTGEWTDVDYSKTKIKDFSYYSNLVFSTGDDKIGDKDPEHKWNTCVILQMEGDLKAVARPGFYQSADGVCRISGWKRKVGENNGKFAMRVGPKSRNFFVVSSAPVVLKLVEIKDVAYVSKMKIDLY